MSRDSRPKHDDRPKRKGLYNRDNDRDACGVGFVANIKNTPSHDIVKRGLRILVNLDHRGAVGADTLAGDGAGILIQIPDAFLRAECGTLGIDLPAFGDYAVGLVFLPRNEGVRASAVASIEETTAAEGQRLLGWRDVPVDNSRLGRSVKSNEPAIKMFFVGRGENAASEAAFQSKLFVIRKRAHHRLWDTGEAGRDDFYVVSFSTRTICYKGMVLGANLPIYFKDLADERVESAIAMAHQRFSTNTFPSWSLAQPFRYLCHNGEINTLRGNVNWMHARRHNMRSERLGADLEKLWPLIGDNVSDSATFDNALELLVAGGYSLSHAMMMMIPEAWADNPLMSPDRRAFYEYHAALMEPWDGPAAVAFTDGRQIGATLDRNGLRPARYVITDDDLCVMASEVGVLPDIPEERIVAKWRLRPGKMFLIDLEEGRIVDDEEIKSGLAGAKPYREWLNKTQINIENLPREVAAMTPDDDVLMDRQQAFGYTQEDVGVFLRGMALSGLDPVGSMGRDTPIAVLSDKPKMLFDYFKQNFAQVTNPPIDPIREELVMSLVSLIGPRPNLLDLDTGGKHKRLEVRQPILTNVDLERIRRIENHVDNAFRTHTLDIAHAAADGAEGMEAALARLCGRAEEVVESGHNILILSDRGMDEDHVAIPSLLATAAVHHHLIRKGLRTEVGLVVETGEARRTHDFCLLAGYGAEAINPYLALDTLSCLRRSLPGAPSDEEVHERFIKAIDKGILKVMSKMGISTYQSYCGAQIFDAVGLKSRFVEKYFTGTRSQIEGVGIDEIAVETLRRHRIAFGDNPIFRDQLDVGGDLAYRIRGEEHVWTPEVVGKLQHAVRSGDRGLFKDYAALVNDNQSKIKTLRGLFKFKRRNPIPVEDVEPASEIVKRFATGAMSFGSISHEAHATLAIAMNRLGAKSNTGEGGERAERHKIMENGDSMRSAVKQVASGRFGVTAEYLVNADMIQIKMAQGAKPGEGGQLPGGKVDENIAKVRHSTPGVGLISPPPHHDIYSIEDLAQLIHDLKNVNPKADISVKLVSEIGVGTVAAGVSKAHADHVTISGFEGGTGASPLTSIMHAGSPWEVGLAETHQTLVINDLRGRIAVQVDGGVRTGRDIVVGALLGADEFGFGTSALIAEGCVMMRKCHLNTCPVGVATQDPELRKRFIGRPEHVVNFFVFLAEDVREIMAELGFRAVNEMIGRVDILEATDAIDHWKANGLDFSGLFHRPDVDPNIKRYKQDRQEHGLDKALDNALIERAAPALEKGAGVDIQMSIRNVNRTFGAMLGGEVARRYGHAGLPEDTIRIKLDGSAGQSFGAWATRGTTITLEGDANDYVGKGLSGGKLVIRPSAVSPIVAEENMIVGNTVLYGAIAGECYFRGVAGERFAVRNSGATAVVEGIGDHGCEYMTGGIVVVLGPTGRNFAAGMSGGVAYVLDERGSFAKHCNMAMVDLESVAAEVETPGHRGNGPEPHGPVDADADMTGHDARRLKGLIRKHLDHTGSTRAKMILDDWNTWLDKFVKVMPLDYRRALEEMRVRERATSRDDIRVAVGG